jgi:uncharacterized protein YndB with AHSA1/START domain/GNAT superfamily N-acetyltransferase
MITEPVCREATPDDLAAVCRLGAEVNLLHHQAWPDIFAGPGDPMAQAAHWQRGIAATDAATFVAEQGTRVVGFVTVSEVRDGSPLLQPVPFARVGTVSVDERHRGQGIGRALMQQAEAWAMRRGLTDLRLHVWHFNQRALHLYEEIGYEVRSHVLGKRLATGGAADERVFRTARTLAFPPEDVWAAFASAHLLSAWWGPDGFSNAFETFDFRVGGRWRFVMHSPDGKAYLNENVFLALESQRRVVIRHDCAPYFTLAVRLAAENGGTRLQWEQSFDDAATALAVKAVVAPANEQNLDRLTRVLAACGAT